VCACVGVFSVFFIAGVAFALRLYPEVTPYAGPHKSWHFRQFVLELTQGGHDTEIANAGLRAWNAPSKHLSVTAM
jgi:hypothetical protein